MNSGKNKAAGGAFGYTVVEVMIVLAISGLMFVIAANFIAGRQEKTSFSQGVDAMASQLQNTIEQVTDGQYGDTLLTCTALTEPPTFKVGGSGQGTNNPCIYLGKLLHFYGSGNAGYEVFTIAGQRTNPANGQPTDCLSACGNSAWPTAIDDPGTPNGVNLTTQETVPQNLSVNSVTIDATAGTAVSPPSYAFGFVEGLGTSDTADQVSGTNSYQTGAQVVSLVYAPGINSASMGESNAASAITNNLVTATSATLCLTDGTQYAQIGVGDSSTNGNQLTVKVTMLGSTPCQ